MVPSILKRFCVLSLLAVTCITGCGSPESLKSDFESIDFRAYDSREALIEALGREPDVMKNVDLLAATGENTPEDLTIEVWEWHFNDGRMVEIPVGAGPEGFHPQKGVRIEKQGEGMLGEYREAVKELALMYEESRSLHGDRETDAKINQLLKNEDQLYSSEN